MKKLLSLALLLFVFLVAEAQEYKYAVHFTHKNFTPYSVDQPEEFLSQRAIDRRAKYNIPIIEEDLPIDPELIENILGLNDNFELIIHVKWLNAIIISTPDSTDVEILDLLDDVEKVVQVYNSNFKSSKSDKLSFDLKEEQIYAPHKSTQAYDSAFYGGGWVQINQLKGEKLHELGYKGQGMVIAVLDAGFVGVDERQIFQSLWDNDQILGTKNMVAPGETVFATHTHGTAVLSTMGGYWEGNLVGTAPDADYWLIRTEDGASEALIEEYNWVAGAAFADSVGADVLNTSLGYTTFDDLRTDHTWEELNGDLTIITRGSNMAFRKGMLVVNSAGNSGNSSWRYVGAPADGYQVFSIGAVDGSGNIASFSSHGFPWSDDIKPNVVARGAGAYVASAFSDVVAPSNGTSFSGPIIAGMTASLWSADPTVSPKMVKQAIQYSANRFNEPDTLYGYGLPDYENALGILGMENLQSENQNITVAPNPVSESFSLDLQTKEYFSFTMRIFNIQGALIEERKMNWNGSPLNIDIKSYTRGIYFVEVHAANRNSQIKITKL
ncbi:MULTISPECIES: S8/S53 family peptidase [unclassified Lentimicrobium]|uniref:S8/S53 family peptidase n=1 Tax=unclassified Lentimicrobium TaxID=2677434 RepID=UPI001554BADB|nr:MULTISPECIES: S8/S53 family peptidase [unclassified Lentimicrobium]NPD45491.1 S8 family serine peptidase [Lentimicrobium sp. S6]NPD84001.1 S8 family serine peptidase [Lentimicrobium sp. L6]